MTISASEILQRESKVPLLLLGCFHFKNPGLDEFVPEHDFNAKSPERQEEIGEVVEHLAQFEPTKVAVERRREDQEEVDEDFRHYLAGEWELPNNEAYQIGFRLAEKMGHDRVFAIDATGDFYEPLEKVKEFASEHGQDQLLEGPLLTKFMELMKCHDEMKKERSLREHLRHLNSEDFRKLSHGVYLTERFEVGLEDEYPGVDFVTEWYRRNMKIFANLQRNTETVDDRIVVVYGAGHLALLHHLATYCPKYEVVETNDYLATVGKAAGKTVGEVEASR